MERRTLLSALAAAGTATAAGCLSEQDPTEEGNGTTTDEAVTDEDDDPSRGPEATAEAFLDAFTSGDAARINELMHDEGPVEEVASSEAQELASRSITVERTETVESGQEEATVEVLFRTGDMVEAGAAAVSQTLELRVQDGEWRVWSRSSTPRGESSIAPGAVFEVDHAGETATISHQGGDRVRADALFVRGDGLDATGSWAALGGEASDERDGTAAVVAGDSLTVGVDAAFAVRVVWEPDGATAVTMTEAAAASSTESVTANDDGDRGDSSTERR